MIERLGNRAACPSPVDRAEGARGIRAGGCVDADCRTSASTDGGAHLTVGACVVRALVLVVALAVLEVVWLRTGRGPLVAALAVALGLLIAASVVAWPGWWWRALTGIRTAVALLVLITAACVTGTFVVQDSDLVGYETEAARLDAFARRQGAFFRRLLHRTPDVALSADREGHFEALAGRFGRRYATEERRAELRARAAEAQARALENWLARRRVQMVALHELLWTLRLSDVFRSWWFAGLLGALAVNVGFCSGRRLRVRWRRVGFAGIHLGVVLILLGAAMGRVSKETGALPVAVGFRGDRYVRGSDGREVPLGFSLALQDFRTDYRRELICSFPGPSGERLTRAFRVKPGAVIRLGPEPVDRPTRHAYTLTVEAFIARARPAGAVEAFSARPLRPAVEVAVSRPGAPDAAHWLLAGSDECVAAEDRSYTVRFHHARTAAAYDRWLAETVRESFGTLVLRAAGRGEPVDTDLRVGGPGQTAVCDLGGRLYFVEIIDVLPDALSLLGVSSRPAAYRPLPAVRVRVTDPAGRTEEHLVIQAERFQVIDRPAALEAVQARYVVEAGTLPLERYVMLAAPERPTVLVPFLAGRRTAPLELRPGQPVRVPGTETTFTLGRFIGQAVFPLEPAPADERAHPSRFDGRDQPGIRLRIDGPLGPDVVWLHAAAFGRHTVTYPDGELRVEYRDHLEAMPEDYRALIGVYEGGRLVAERVVEVNRPLRHRGYMVYLDDTEYRQMTVVRDPSLPLVYVGLVVMVVGTAVHFLVIRPLT